MSRSAARAAVFGSFDGLCTCFGVLIAPHHGLLRLIAGIAAAGGASMAAGEYLSDSSNGLRPSLAMGGATSAGTAIPALPFLALHGWLALGCSILLSCGVALGIASINQREHGWRRAARDVYVVLAVVLVVTAGVQAGFGAAA